MEEEKMEEPKAEEVNLLEEKIMEVDGIEYLLPKECNVIGLVIETDELYSMILKPGVIKNAA